MDKVLKILTYKFIKTDSISVSLYSIIFIILIFVLIHLLLRAVKFILTRLTQRNEDFDKSKIYTIIQLLRYVLYLAAIVLILDNIGININALLIGSAAFLAAIGLGLQTIFQDIVSGFVIFFEGVIHRGDILELSDQVVQVEEINIRTSKVKNRDGNYIIIPNSKLVTNDVINWSHQSNMSRFSISIGVAYGSDTELVKRLLIECAQNHPLTLKSKDFDVWFTDFADSSLQFKLLFWAVKSWDSEFIRSDLRFEIDKAFRNHNIKIPFPQRELHYASEDSKS